MKRLLGIFNSKKMTADKIYEQIQKTLQENERLELLEMAKKVGKEKKK